jgi:molybdopterin-binding protein
MQANKHSQWQGTVRAIYHGSVISEVILEMAPNISVKAVASTISLETLRLEVGSKARVLINSTDFTLAID